MDTFRVKTFTGQVIRDMLDLAAALELAQATAQADTIPTEVYRARDGRLMAWFGSDGLRKRVLR